MRGLSVNQERSEISRFRLERAGKEYPIKKEISRCPIRVERSRAPTPSRPEEIVPATQAGLLVLSEPFGVQYLGNKIEPSHFILMSALTPSESATRVEAIVNHDDTLSPPPTNKTFLLRRERGARRATSQADRLQPSTAGTRSQRRSFFGLPWRREVFD